VTSRIPFVNPPPSHISTRARVKATRDNRHDAHNQDENAKLASTNIRGATRDVYWRFELLEEDKRGRAPSREREKIQHRRRGE